MAMNLSFEIEIECEVLSAEQVAELLKEQECHQDSHST